ncbi:MAG: right-handed parallel beta-helix repeat-containing protein [Planctomycetaceae bacterium]|nr:right-handed parallel beta-helix repeat-containing protein [Planctomycetaceae bacterium]
MRLVASLVLVLAGLIQSTCAQTVEELPPPRLIEFPRTPSRLPQDPNWHPTGTVLPRPIPLAEQPRQQQFPSAPRLIEQDRSSAYGPGSIEPAAYQQLVPGVVIEAAQVVPPPPPSPMPAPRLSPMPAPAPEPQSVTTPMPVPMRPMPAPMTPMQSPMPPPATSTVPMPMNPAIPAVTPMPASPPPQPPVIPPTPEQAPPPVTATAPAAVPQPLAPVPDATHMYAQPCFPSPYEHEPWIGLPPGTYSPSYSSSLCLPPDDNSAPCAGGGIWCDGERCDGGVFGSQGYNPLFTNNGCGWFEPFADFQIKPGNNRTLGDGRLFLPLWQDGDNLLFADLRGQIDNHDAAEGNWGLGFRRFMDAGWIFGFYGYYDLLHSRNNNNFGQATVGIEVLTLNWDFRVNGYIPEDGEKFSGATAGFSGGTVVVNNFGERAYGGVDFETGYRVGHWGENDHLELRWFVGGFFFDAGGPGYREMIGPKTRLELRLYDFNLFGIQSRLEGGAEFSWDQVRDEQAFGYLRFRVPLNFAPRDRLGPLRRRMLDVPVRDMDIVSSQRMMHSERAMSASGAAVDRLIQLSADDDVALALQEAGAETLIALDGSNGVFYLDSYDSFSLQPGQTLVGGGSRIQLHGEQSGHLVDYVVPGSRPTVVHAGQHQQLFYVASPTPLAADAIAPYWWFLVDSPPTVQLADRTEVRGLDLIGGSTAISGQGIQQAVIDDISIRHAQGTAIELVDSQQVQVRNTHIRDGNNTAISISGGGEINIQQLTIRGGLTGIQLQQTADIEIAATDIRELDGSYGIWPVYMMNANVDAMYSEFMPAIVAPTTNGISGYEAENVRLHNNSIEAMQPVNLYRSSGALQIRENELHPSSNGWSFGNEGAILVHDFLNGSAEIIGNRIEPSGDVPYAGPAISVSLAAMTTSRNVRVDGNAIANWIGDGLFIRHEGLASQPQSNVTLRNNSIDYTAIGSPDWMTRNAIDAVRIQSRGQLLAALDGNQIELATDAEQHQTLRSYISTWGDGAVDLSLRSNSFPIETLQLDPIGDAEIRLLENIGNSFVPSGNWIVPTP